VQNSTFAGATCRKITQRGKTVRRELLFHKGIRRQRAFKTRLSEINQGAFVSLDYKKLTFDELGQEFLSDYQINQRKSYWRAELSLNHLNRFFGGMKACTIDTPLIRKYIKERQAEGLKTRPLIEIAALCRMFKLAAQDDRIQRIPHFPMLEENNIRSGFLEPE
jgi:hypothetical protein